MTSKFPKNWTKQTNWRNPIVLLNEKVIKIKDNENIKSIKLKNSQKLNWANQLEKSDSPNVVIAVIFPLIEIEIEIGNGNYFFLQKWKVRMEFNLKWN